MTTPRKPTAREAWEAIDATSFQAEVDRVVGMSDDEVEAELLKDGFDPSDLVAPALPPAGKKALASPAAVQPVAASEGPAAGKSEAVGAKKAEPIQAEKTKAPIPLRRTRWQVLLVAATLSTVALALGGMGVVAIALRESDQKVAQSAKKAAAELRAKGFGACDRHEWQMCLSYLDQAKARDSEGDSATRVQQARAEAERALAPEQREREGGK